jgi:hypothetical protein
MIVPGVAALLIGLVLLMSAITDLSTCVTHRPAPFTVGTTGIAEVIRDPDAYDRLQTGLCYNVMLMRNIWQMLRALLVVVFGTATTGVGTYLNRERVTADMAEWRPPVPLGPVSDRIKATETLSAEVTLDIDGHSTACLKETIQGEIDPGLRFTSFDRQRIEEYYSKYGLGYTDLAFCAGYLALSGPSRLHFEMRPIQRNLLLLRGQTHDYPYLIGERGSSDPTWPVTWRYTVPLDEEEPGDWNHVPVRLVPLLAEMGNARQLRLELQFDSTQFPLLKAGQAVVLEDVQVWMESRLFGRPQSSGIVSQVGEGRGFAIEWQGIQFAVKEGTTRFLLPAIQFSQEIKVGAHLVGRVRLRVPALRSGLRGMRYFSAVGQPVSEKEQPQKPFPFQGVTYVETEFRLALSSLSQVRLVTLPLKIEFPVALDPKRVRSLLEVLSIEPADGQSARQVYVQHVVQSLPRISGQEADLGRQHWDISGRRYDQTLPVDFHLVIYAGAEEHDRENWIEGTVQSYVSGESSQAVQDTHNELCSLLNQAIAQMRTSA